MIQLTAHMPLFIGLDPIDFRCGIDKLSLLSEQISGFEAKSGCVFVFRNTAATSVKILVFDGTGFWLMQKRLSSGRFEWWPKESHEAKLSAAQLQVLFQGTDPRSVSSTPWQRIKTIIDEERPRPS